MESKSDKDRRKERKKRRREKRRLLRKLKEQGVFIPTEVEEIVQ